MRLFAAGLLALLLFGSAPARAQAQDDVMPSPSPSPSAAPPPRPSPTPLSKTVTKAEGKQLLAEFGKAQRSETKALEHRQSFEQKEMKASQAARRKEWLAKETDKRHKFLQDHHEGPETRAYIRDYLDRLKALDQIAKDERERRTREQKIRAKSVKDDQTARLKEFNEYLAKGLRPPASLWPETAGQ